MTCNIQNPIYKINLQYQGRSLNKSYNPANRSHLTCSPVIFGLPISIYSRYGHANEYFILWLSRCQRSGKYSIRREGGQKPRFERQSSCLYCVAVCIFNTLFNVKLIALIRVSKLQFLQKYLWVNAGFTRLRNLADLSEYSNRYYVRLGRAVYVVSFAKYLSPL